LGCTKSRLQPLLTRQAGSNRFLNRRSYAKDIASGRLRSASSLLVLPALLCAQLRTKGKLGGNPAFSIAP
jgi:hypothetical protein